MSGHRKKNSIPVLMGDTDADGYYRITDGGCWPLTEYGNRYNKWEAHMAKYRLAQSVQAEHIVYACKGSA